MFPFIENKLLKGLNQVEGIIGLVKEILSKEELPLSQKSAFLKEISDYITHSSKTPKQGRELLNIIKQQVIEYGQKIESPDKFLDLLDALKASGLAKQLDIFIEDIRLQSDSFSRKELAKIEVERWVKLIEKELDNVPLNPHKLSRAFQEAHEAFSERYHSSATELKKDYYTQVAQKCEALLIKANSQEEHNSQLALICEGAALSGVSLLSIKEDPANDLVKINLKKVFAKRLQAGVMKEFAKKLQDEVIKEIDKNDQKEGIRELVKTLQDDVLEKIIKEDQDDVIKEIVKDDQKEGIRKLIKKHLEKGIRELTQDHVRDHLIKTVLTPSTEKFVEAIQTAATGVSKEGRASGDLFVVGNKHFELEANISRIVGSFHPFYIPGDVTTNRPDLQLVENAYQQGLEQSIESLMLSSKEISLMGDIQIQTQSENTLGKDIVAEMTPETEKFVASLKDATAVNKSISRGAGGVLFPNRDTYAFHERNLDNQLALDNAVLLANALKDEYLRAYPDEDPCVVMDMIQQLFHASAIENGAVNAATEATKTIFNSLKPSFTTTSRVDSGAKIRIEIDDGKIIFCRLLNLRLTGDLEDSRGVKDLPILEERITCSKDERGEIHLSSQLTVNVDVSKRAEAIDKKLQSNLQDFLNQKITLEEHLRRAEQLKNELSCIYVQDVVDVLYSQVGEGDTKAKEAISHLHSASQTLNRIISSKGFYPSDSSSLQADQVQNILSAESKELPNKAHLLSLLQKTDDEQNKGIFSRLANGKAQEIEKEVTDNISAFLEKRISEEESLETAQRIIKNLDSYFTPHHILALYKLAQKGDKAAQEALTNALSARLLLHKVISEKGGFSENLERARELNQQNFLILSHINSHEGMSDQEYAQFLRKRTDILNDQEMIIENNRLKGKSFSVQKDVDEEYTELLKGFKKNGEVTKEKIQDQFTLDNGLRMYDQGMQTYLQGEEIIRSELMRDEAKKEETEVTKDTVKRNTVEENRVLAEKFEQMLEKEIPDEDFRLKVMTFLQQGGRADSVNMAMGLYNNLIPDPMAPWLIDGESSNKRFITVEGNGSKVTIRHETQRNIIHTNFNKKDNYDYKGLIQTEIVVVLTKDGNDQKSFITTKLIPNEEMK